MLDTLTRRMSGIFQGLRRKGRLSEADVSEVLREVRVALLEADVNFGVAKAFVAKVKERAVGEDLYGSLDAEATLIRIVRDELVAVLGGDPPALARAPSLPTVILMCGLQGSGKTTTTAKLARRLIEEGRKPMLAACDVQRPAAVRQLEILGETVGAPVFSLLDGTNPVEIARRALERAKHLLLDTLIVDTAGRLAVNEELMEELARIHATVRPTETLLVLDATTGQEAVAVAEAFHRRVALTGAIFTKLDGDARGGAVLSVRQATGVPVRFTGVGEGVEALEPFFPARLAERILGMGDILGLIEKAERAFEGEDMARLEREAGDGKVDFNTMLQQFRMMRKMGSMKNIMKMIPGLSGAIPEEALDQIGDKDVNRVEAIILSMTHKERSNPDIINGSRRKRIAAGSGTSVEEVNNLIRRHGEMRRMMKGMSKLQGRLGKAQKRR